MSIINPKIDLVFKKLFGSEENKDILLSLVNAVLPQHQQIVTLVLKNPYNLADYLEGKLSILDIKAEDENGIQYDIEMQIKGTGFYGKRTLYYWAKMFGSQLDSLTDEEREERQKAGYADLKKCIVISLMDFTFFDDELYHRCFMLKNRETNEIHKDLDYLDLYFVELKKPTKDLKSGNVLQAQTVLERWINFLNNAYRYSRNTLPPELAEITAIKKANARLEVMYLDKQERTYYESQQKFFLDENSRITAAVDAALEKAADQAEIAVKIAVGKAQAQAEQAAKIAQAEAQQAAKIAQAEAQQAAKIAVSVAEIQAKQAKQIEIAKNLKSLGISNDDISKATQLSIEEIEKL